MWGTHQSRVRGGEKWLETEKFDVVAKTEPTASVDTIRGLLQTLMAQRFHLKVHKEMQPVSVYAFTLGKSKLKEADPSARSMCKGGFADGARTCTCQNATLTQAAEVLRNNAAQYVDRPIVDLTG